MERLRQYSSMRSPKKQLNRIGETGEDSSAVFDSFSESRDSSCRDGSVFKGSLFSFLSEAAKALQKEGVLSERSEGEAASVCPIAGPLSTADEKDLTTSAAALQQANASQQVQAARLSRQIADQPGRLESTQLDSLAQCPQENDSNSCVVNAASLQRSLSSTGISIACEQSCRSSTGLSHSVSATSESSGPLVTTAHEPLSSMSSAKNSSQAFGVCSDASEPLLGPSVSASFTTEHIASFTCRNDSFPAGMGPRQGSWATSNLSSGSAGLAKQGSLAKEDDEVPNELFYHQLSTGGRLPAGRWAHASAVVGQKLFVFGGAAGGSHGEGYIFDAGRNVWRQLPASKDAPPPLFGHAACSVQRTVYVFAGRHGHKHSRRLYTLDTDALVWKAHKESAAAPRPCSGHTMTSVGRHGIYVFGGEGRKVGNALYALDPSTITWAHVNTVGVAPPSRQGHTAIWDHADSLIIFGGNHGERLYNDVRVLSLSTGFWSEATCGGCVPPVRHSHSAVLCGPSLMLIWGGCGERGVVLNDAYILNTATYTWHELKSIGTPPSGRYCHTCDIVGSRLLMFGGTNARQAYDSLIAISIDYGKQLGSLASQLSELTGPSFTEDSKSELVRLQLGNHLRQRAAQDVSQVALSRAEIAERLFEQERQRNAQQATEIHRLQLLLQEEEAKRQEQAAAASLVRAELQHDRDREMYRANELHARLQAAEAVVQRQAGQAVVVDGYKRMYDRLVAERGAMLDRTVDLEHRTRCMEALVAQLEGQLRAARLISSQGRVHDPWEEELDRRERADRL